MIKHGYLILAQYELLPLGFGWALQKMPQPELVINFLTLPDLWVNSKTKKKPPFQETPVVTNKDRKPVKVLPWAQLPFISPLYFMSLVYMTLMLFGKLTYLNTHLLVHLACRRRHRPVG